MSKKNGRTARHRSLVRELAKLRVEAGLTPEEAARALGWSRTKLVRIENTDTMPAVGDVNQILGVYGGTDEGLRLAILELTKHIRERGWWLPFTDILDGSYAELEDDADRILSFQTQLVPGLLQTERYAADIFELDKITAAEARRRIKVRLKRQAILDRAEPPFLDVILTEEVLTRPIGGPDVMREQLRALLDAMDRPNVSVRVIPQSIGRYPAIGQGSLVIFQFDSPIELNTAYAEIIAGGNYIEATGMVKDCEDMYAEVATAAKSKEETRALIAKMI